MFHVKHKGVLCLAIIGFASPLVWQLGSLSFLPFCRWFRAEKAHNVNNKIIVAVVFVAGTGIANRYLNNNSSITTVVVGSYILLLVLSVMDMFGGQLSQLAGAIAMLLVVYTLFGKDPKTQQPLFPWQQLINLVQGKKA
jgi:hypothetical protein